ncbi:hypothetical protein ACFY9N_05780 [Microbacterium sp. NPDC008134]|uniref:hypothetical protein n=1 Tax=Microbacterium sp. NPDC008134 TaxID=3364183 RepID=UPI0036E3A3D9
MYGADQPALLKRNVGERAVLMTLGLKMLDADEVWDSVLVTQPWLAMELGVDVQTVARLLKSLTDRGILTHPRGGPFRAGRYRVKALTKKRIKIVREWDGVARGLIGEEAGPIARVLTSVTHPTWTYSDKLGLTHWAMLLADTAEVDPMKFGIRPRMATKLRRELKAEYELVPGVVVPYLERVLERLADDIDYGTTDKKTGERITARVAKARAMVAYEVQKAANKAAAEEATRRRKGGHATLNALLELHPIPRTPFDRRLSKKSGDVREQDSLAWVNAVHGLIISETPNDKARKIVGELLTKRLVKHGYPLGFAEGVVSYIMQAGDDVTLEEWISRLSGDDRPSTPSRRRGLAAR